jgi:hypothetical protein
VLQRRDVRDEELRESTTTEPMIKSEISKRAMDALNMYITLGDCMDNPVGIQTGRTDDYAFAMQTS